MGNIVMKTDVHATAIWSYHATKKHAVTNAGGNTFTYDANGNQITRNANDVTWTSYNYPSRVENGTKYHDFFYDADRQRWKQVYYNGSANETTIFVGGILEKHTAGSLTEYRHYIAVGSQPVALYTRPSSGSTTTQYFHLDHLGSVAEVSNASGAVDVSMNFDAFGQRRDATDWVGPPAPGVLTTIAGTSQRGYAFHTNLESNSLIHMNGRVADGLTGRFLSADPYIPNAGITQSFNRYSYVRNNPLTLTDPSGFCEFTCATIVSSVFGTVANFFGGRHKYTPPPPKGCWVAANACYGKAGSSKLFDMVNDILQTPGQRMAGGWPGTWGNGQFGTGPCGQYCLSASDNRGVVEHAIEAGKGAISYPRGFGRFIEQMARRHGSRGPGDQVQASVIEERLLLEVLATIRTFPGESAEIAYETAKDNPARVAGRFAAGAYSTAQIRSLLTRKFGSPEGAILGSGIGFSVSVLVIGGDVLYAVEQVARENKIFITTVDPTKPILPQLGEDRFGIVVDSVSDAINAAISGDP
jgi:RHS repeat-associated protein